MPDSPETKVLKDINRHLKNIDEGGETAAASPEMETIKVMQGVLGNFESIMDAKLKRVILTSERAFNQAFGNLQGFDAKQNDSMISELDNVIDELQINNRLAMKSDDLQFLAEKERDEEVKINEETNEILEDIRDQGEEKGRGGAEGLTGLPLEIIGGLLTALGLKGLGAKLFSKAGLIGLGKILAKSIFAAFSLKHFFEGFAEDKDDLGKSFSARLISGLGNMIEALTFGLIDDKLIEEYGAILRQKMSEAGENLQEAFDKFWRGGSDLADVLADTFSALSLGVLSPEAVKKIGDSIDFFVEQLGQAIQDAILRKIGFDIDTPEERETKAREEKEIKEFRFKQRLEPELERLMQDAGLSFKRKTNLRELLGGKQFSPLSPTELKKLSPEEGAKENEKRLKARDAFLTRHMESLQAKIDRQIWLDERNKKKEDAAALKVKKAEEKSVELSKMAQDAIEAERAVSRTKERVGQGGETNYVDASTRTTQTPDTSVDNDDVNINRELVNGLFPPRR